MDKLIEQRRKDSFPVNLCLTLLLRCGAKGISPDVLFTHLNILASTAPSLSGTNTKKTLTLKAQATSVVTLLKPVLSDVGNDPQKVVEAVRKIATETAAFCTNDAYESGFVDVGVDRRTKKIEMQIASLFGKLGCIKYRGNEQEESGRHPQLRLKGIFARWYLPPTQNAGTEKIAGTEKVAGTEKIAEDLLTVPAPPAN